VLVDRAVHVGPRPVEAHVQFVHPPLLADWSAMGPGRLLKKWEEAVHPAIDGACDPRRAPARRTIRRQRRSLSGSGRTTARLRQSHHRGSYGARRHSSSARCSGDSRRCSASAGRPSGSVHPAGSYHCRIVRIAWSVPFFLSLEHGLSLYLTTRLQQNPRCMAAQ
jgi:hypothetical protein